jgi:LEA14-like dessication related protein
VFLSRRRIVLIGVIVAIALAIILLPLILTITLPPNLNSVTISLSKVEVTNNITNNTTNEIVPLNVFFDVHNPTDKTLTTSGIEYELFANGNSLGQGTLSYEDIPVNGRPQLLSHSTTMLQSVFQLTNSSSNMGIFNKLVQGPEVSKKMKWRVNGTAQIESGFSSSPKQFSDEL